MAKLVCLSSGKPDSVSRTPMSHWWYDWWLIREPTNAVGAGAKPRTLPDSSARSTSVAIAAAERSSAAPLRTVP